MALPKEIGDAAQDADKDAVMAWLNAGGSIDDVDDGGYTLVNCCAAGGLVDEIIRDGHVALARDLIALGADVNIVCTVDGDTPLLRVLNHRDREPQQMNMFSLLLAAKASVNVSNWSGQSPLCLAILRPSEPSTTMVTELLRAGASLDACRGSPPDNETAEDVIQSKERNDPAVAENEHWCATKRLVAGVRQHGSYKRYARSFHRDVLAVRGLAQRGKLRTDDPVLNFLARLGDNGVCWHILSFWRATN
jgi:hypothetical protein